MRFAIALATLISIAPALARADVVWSAPCPFGARERTSHSGPRCAPWACTTDGDCEGGLVCRPWRVCVQTHSVSPAGRGAFRQPPPPHIEEPQVVGSCPPTEACTGSEAPRPPTSGRPVGAVRCEVASYCVRPPLDPLPSAPANDRPQEDTPSQTREAASTAPADVAPTSGSACGCRASSRDRAPLAAIVLALVLAWWRTR